MENDKMEIDETAAATAEPTTEPEAVTEAVAEEPAATATEDEPTAVLTPEELDRLVSEAEERGYLRGRNEAVETLMNRPGHRKPAETEDDDGDDAVMILREMRRSVWD